LKSVNGKKKCTKMNKSKYSDILTKKYLQNAYISKNLNMAQIGRDLKIRRSIISAHLKKHNINKYLKCLQCGSLFLYTKSTRIHCSTKCRKKYNWKIDQVKYKEKRYVARKEYYQKNKEQEKIKSLERYNKNKKNCNLRSKQWKAKNKSRVIEYKRNYRKIPHNHMVHCLRSRLGAILKNKKERKRCSVLKLIGCTSMFLKKHLESKFTEGMSWKNYGFYGWHVDHIRPCNSFDFSKKEEQKNCFHYSNLQPLWANDNFSKGNKYIQKEKKSGK